MNSAEIEQLQRQAQMQSLQQQKKLQHIQQAVLFWGGCVLFSFVFIVFLYFTAKVADDSAAEACDEAQEAGGS